MIVDTRSTVETPEGVDFQFVIAGPGKRAIAFLFDILVRIAVVLTSLLIMTFVLGMTFGREGAAAASQGMFLVALFFAVWLYGAAWEGFWNGQTPGKRWCNLRVVRTNGTPIGWFEAFGRNLLLAADVFWVIGVIPMCTAALFSMMLTRRIQRLGDLVCDTMVIDESRDFGGRSRGILHQVEPIPRSQCSGRYHVPERSLAVIERLFDSDRLISDGRREEIARPLAKVLIERLGFEEPGPASDNPNSYFVKAPIRHVDFLKRVLKTFAVDQATPSDVAKPKRSSYSTRRGQQLENVDPDFDFIDTAALEDAGTNEKVVVKGEPS